MGRSEERLRRGGRGIYTQYTRTQQGEMEPNTMKSRIKGEEKRRAGERLLIFKHSRAEY